MSDIWLRRVIMVAIVLLVLHAVGTWTYAALGPAAAIVAAVLVGAVSVFSARMAGSGRGSHAWFVVPTAVFTAVPLAGRLWTLLTVEQSWWTRTVEFAPFLLPRPSCCCYLRTPSWAAAPRVTQTRRSTCPPDGRRGHR